MKVDGFSIALHMGMLAMGFVSVAFLLYVNCCWSYTGGSSPPATSNFGVRSITNHQIQTNKSFGAAAPQKM